MKKKVLVFPCGTEIANEILASLEHNKTFEVVLASSEDNSYCSFRNKKIHLLPYVTNISFFNDLTNLIAAESIEFVIPAHDDVAHKLSEIEDKLQAKVIGQSYAVNQIVRYKDKTYKHFSELLPIGRLYKDVNDLNEFPLFVKPKKGQGSLNAFSIKNKEELSVFKNNYEIDDFVIMECFTGEEYTIDCFSDNGEVLFAGARTRDKAIRGISVISHSVTDPLLVAEFEKYAQIISHKLDMHGLWFYQMKVDQQGSLKLLEIAPRVSGTMMLNRAKGINFVELALYQAQGYDVKTYVNNVDISVGRSLVPSYKHNYNFNALYVDFDDTLFIDESYINTDVMKLIFQAKNERKPVFLITKNKKNNLARTLHRFGISHIFEDILHLKEDEFKKDYMQDSSMLIDDSFAERIQAIEFGHFALGVDAVKVLF